MTVISLDAQLCDGCGICIEDCPMDVFKLDPITDKAIMAYNQDCSESCVICEDACPMEAIKASGATEKPQFRPF